MATTSPDNIRTPDPSDSYNLVSDLALFATDTQNALVRRANMYVGTSAQRTAMTTAPAGSHWQDTNGNQLEWVWTGSAWRIIRASGTLTINAAPNTTTSSNVTFPGTFLTTPAVVLTGQGAPGTAITNINIRPQLITTTGFQAQAYNSHSSSTITVPMQWIAI